MPEIVVDDQFREIFKRHGAVAVARALGRRYSDVRKAAIKAGLQIRRPGGRRTPAIAKRDQEIRDLRWGKQWLLRDLSERYNLSIERIRQITQEDPRAQTNATATEPSQEEAPSSEP